MTHLFSTGWQHIEHDETSSDDTMAIGWNGNNYESIMNRIGTAERRIHFARIIEENVCKMLKPDDCVKLFKALDDGAWQDTSKMEDEFSSLVDQIAQQLPLMRILKKDETTPQFLKWLATDRFSRLETAKKVFFHQSETVESYHKWVAEDDVKKARKEAKVNYEKKRVSVTSHCP
jgi:hypothetical protein